MMGRMDVLVVVDGAPVPERVAARARRRIDVPAQELAAATLAELRAHIPRSVGVIGPTSEAATHHVVRIARQLHQAGLPVTVYSDVPIGVEPGIEVDRISDAGPPIDAADSLLDLIGHTPMVRMDRIGRDLSAQLLGKLEYLNPGGSIKDRPALAMIDAAERDGSLTRGGTIVEPTSGNTGVGLAIVAARRGYRCIFTMPDKIADEKVSLLRAFGAEVVVCPTAVDPDHPDSYYSVARRLTETTPGAFMPNQYANPHNPGSHEHTTGPEIWRQTAGRVTHVVAGIGTGGTITGIGHYLKSRNPMIQVIGADPEGSVFSGGQGRPYLVEGVGEDFWPATYDRRIADRVVMVSDRDSFLTARRLTREEGILAGGSCGTAMWAALEVGRSLGPDAVIVVVLPDSGRGYLSKVYNDGWMLDHGFLRTSGPAGDTIEAVLAHKTQPGSSGAGSRLPPLVHVHPKETVRSAISILQEYNVSQMPVVKAEPPLSLAEIVGTVTDRGLLERLVAEPSAVDTPVEAVMGPPLPTVGSGEPVDVAAARLADGAAVLVIDAGHPIGIVTRSDLLEFLAGPIPGGPTR
jgi:cystathionine beta-synthase